jgi:L-threonylcarbamoyladenylate synthase
MSHENEIRTAIEKIKDGEVIVYPTDTVYCLGADMTNEKAVRYLYEIKKRPQFDPLFIHIADSEQAALYTGNIPRKAQELMNRFWPGALTIVLHKKPSIPNIGFAGMPGIALRLPNNQVARDLIRGCGVPLASASANRFGNISPTTAQHVKNDLGDEKHYIIDAGACSLGIESTIISFLDDEPRILRPGGVSVEQIEEVIGKTAVARTTSYTTLFPGMSDHHYTRHTIMLFMDQVDCLPNNLQIGLISLLPPENPSEFAAIEVLSPTGDLDEAAKNLFSALRRLEGFALDLIVAVRVPNEGIGRAINDRLARACF